MNETTIKWNVVNLRKAEKNLPEPNRVIIYKNTYDKAGKTYVVISTAETVMWKEHRNSEKETLHYRYAYEYIYPIKSGFEWAYANEIKHKCS